MTAKLTVADVKVARRAVRAGASITALARRHDVAVQTIHDAVYGITWMQITRPAPLPRPSRTGQPDQCTVENCPSDSKEQGLCPAHLYRMERYGDPGGGKYEQRGRKPWRRPRLAPGDARHGTTNGYDHYRCRCGRCRSAHTDAQRRRREAHR